MDRTKLSNRTSAFVVPPLTAPLHPGASKRLAAPLGRTATDRQSRRTKRHVPHPVLVVVDVRLGVEQRGAGIPPIEPRMFIDVLLDPVDRLVVLVQLLDIAGMTTYSRQKS